MNRQTLHRPPGSLLVVLAGLAAAMMLSVAPATASPQQKHWFSRSEVESARAGGDVRAEKKGLQAIRTFDIVISYHGDPQGDDDGNTQGVDIGSADQDKIERIIQFMADGMYESTEGQHKLRNVRIFRNSKKHDTADILWDASGHPQAHLSGVESAGHHIYMFDLFSSSGGAGYDMLADEIGAGYTLAHEWGHYGLGLQDEYVLQPTDIAVEPSMMSNQWNARNGDTRWLNFSIAQQATPAGDFEDTGQTAHHRSYGESCWETLARGNTLLEKLWALLPGRLLRPVYPELATVAPAAGALPSFPNLPGSARSELNIIWMKDDLTYEIVIDRSGSMSSANKMENAKTAAKLLVDLAEEGKTSIGVIAFNSSPTVIVPITEITDQASKDSIKAAINSITAGGGTAIGAAAQAALRQLQSASTDDESRVVFLLTDGLSGDNALAPVPAYVQAQVPIFAFAYGTDADTATLGTMASQTSGNLYISPTSLSQVTQAFQDANAAASSAAGVGSGASSLPPIGQVSETLLVDSTMASLDVGVTHVGGPGTASFVLVSPSGTEHAPFQVDVSGGETLSYFHVDAPEVGLWELRGESSGVETPFSFSASAAPNGSTYSLSSNYSSGSTIHYPEALVLAASLGKERPIAKAHVVAYVEAPDGTITSVELSDDAMGIQDVSDDGTYVGVVDYTQAGTYTVTIRAEGQAGVAMMTSAGLSDSADQFGVAVEATPDTPLSEDFQRFERYQLQVQGVLPDDHGDVSGTATDLGASNGTPTPGKLEQPGDIDVFRFLVPAASNEVTLRVFGLALGMDPRVRVLASDGVQVLAEGTLADAASIGGYLVITVPAPGGTEVFCEVAHTDMGNGTGVYRVSAGSPLPPDEPAGPPCDQGVPLEIDSTVLFSTLDGSAADLDGSADGILELSGLSIRGFGNLTVDVPVARFIVHGAVTVSECGVIRNEPSLLGGAPPQIHLQTCSSVELRDMGRIRSVGTNSGGEITICAGGDVLLLGGAGLEANSGNLVPGSLGGSIRVTSGGVFFLSGYHTLLTTRAEQGGTIEVVSCAEAVAVTLDGRVLCCGWGDYGRGGVVSIRARAGGIHAPGIDNIVALGCAEDGLIEMTCALDVSPWYGPETSPPAIVTTGAFDPAPCSCAD